MENLPQIRCGYYGWLMASQCQNVLEHECFKEYDETTDFLNIDENYVATIAEKQTEAEGAESLSLSQSVNTDFDERLIMAVMNRPSLYDYRLNIKERSKLKKAALWEEVGNTIGGNVSITELQKRWKYHRDCYIRAKRKMKEYVPSGSGASSANFKCTYRFFELMRPLDDALQSKPTISTLSSKVDIYSKQSTVSGRYLPIQQSSSSAVTHCSDIESSDTSFQILTPVISPMSETLKTTLRTAKKQKVHNESELQAALLDVLKMPIPQTDAVDGFLKTIGEALRRLPYRKRTILEIKFLQMVLEAESEETE